jgi:hypothetical protein
LRVGSDQGRSVVQRERPAGQAVDQDAAQRGGAQPDVFGADRAVAVQAARCAGQLQHGRDRYVDVQHDLPGDRFRAQRPRAAAPAGSAVRGGGGFRPSDIEPSVPELSAQGADPAADPVYFVDDHFVPNSGAAPVGKGWNTKRRHANPGGTTRC